MNKTTELAYWINEREHMRIRKEAPGIVPPGAWKYGWSNDPAMGLVRYCNVHREDDKVTKWLAKNWRPEHHAVWEIVLARMINYIPTLEELLAEETAPSVWTPHNIGVRLKLRRASGEKVFTSAYTISTCGRSMDKIDYVMEVVAEVKRTGRGSLKYSLAAFHSDLMLVNGLGSFLAAQVIADLKNTAGHCLQNAPDVWSWSAPGPGSLKGLQEYFSKQVTAGTYHTHIDQCYNEVLPHIQNHVPPMHMQDFQNCLCELSKYERVKRGGHVRNKYRAGQD